MHDSIGRIDAIKIFCDFRAQKSARHRVRRITLHVRGPAIFYRNQNPAGVRAIVRANGVYDLLHGFIIIWLLAAREMS
jgi:bifunctional ADP-heptose synthase (sugar kinase/adenylyltransferase)